MADAAEPSGGASVIDRVVRGHERDLGDGFVVSRLLPVVGTRSIGPFVFFDAIGPTELPAGRGMDVRPHPHIGLATVTYLFEGEFVHRDSVGSELPIRPGEINWMTAGRGIVHSERMTPAQRESGSSIHAVQLWAALPREHEEAEPSFEHRDAHELPEVTRDGGTLRVLVGDAWGMSSPVRALMPTLYVDVALAAGAEVELPMAQERALFLVSGRLELRGTDGIEAAPVPKQALVVLRPGCTAALVGGDGGGRALMIGGAPLDAPRHMFWNFVSSSTARIEQAKQDWREGRFPTIPTDPDDFIPLP
jgi:redox-sensitive bicupin YhaK (pirin superfamily)